MVVELAQKIVNDPTWDPANLSLPRAEDIPATKLLPDEIPFGKAHPLKVDMGQVMKLYIDGFIDDLLSIILDENDIPKKG